MCDDLKSNVIPIYNHAYWSVVARRYIDYLLKSDPRAACYYLDHHLTRLNLNCIPLALRDAIKEEEKRRGIRGGIDFSP